jgi:MFS family permease
VVPTLVLVTMVTAMVSSLGAPLVPQIAEDRDVSIGTAQLSLTAALVVGAIASPLLGRWGSDRRRRGVLLVGLALVCTGCLVAALPLGFGPLLAGRSLQGIGLALNPLAFSAVRALVSEDRAPRVIAGLAAVTVAGGGVGYLLTGLVGRFGGLSACFYVGLVLALVTTILVAVVLPRDHGGAGKVRAEHELVDWLGAIGLAVGTAMVLLTLSMGSSWGWGSWRTCSCASVGAIALTLWVRRSFRVPNPLVDLRLARSEGAFGAHLSAFTVGTGMYVLVTTMMIVVQAPTETEYGLGASVAVAGAMFTSYAMASILGSKLVLRLSERLPPDGVLAVGCVMLVAGAVSIGAFHDNVWQVAISMAVVGLGGGCTFSAMPGIIVRAVPQEETSSSIAFNLVLRYLGFATGSALATAILETVSSAGAITSVGVQATFGAAAFIWVAAALATLLLLRHAAGNEASRDAEGEEGRTGHELGL